MDPCIFVTTLPFTANGSDWNAIQASVDTTLAGRPRLRLNPAEVEPGVTRGDGTANHATITTPGANGPYRVVALPDAAGLTHARERVMEEVGERRGFAWEELRVYAADLGATIASLEILAP